MMNPSEFEHIAQSEEELWWYRGQRDILVQVIEKKLPAHTLRRVLEAGCGTGHTAQFLEERYGWSVTALDLSEVGLRYAQRRGLSRLVQGDISKLPFERGAFDAVISLDVIAHFDEGQERLPISEFARVLKPGGKLLLRTSALDSLRSRHSEYVMERQRFTRERLVSQIERNGFRVLFASYVNALLLPVAWLKFRVWEPLTDAPAASGVMPVSSWMNSLLSVPMALETQWIKMGGRFPNGQTLLVLAEARH